MQYASRIYVAGHLGLVGSAIVRALKTQGFTNLILRTRRELDLTDQAAVDLFFKTEKPEFVFLAAAKVGGIMANAAYPADFIRDNLAIQLHIVDSAFKNGVQKLEFLGSSCIYPKLAPQPLQEDYLLTGPLEPSNQWYAIAKIAGIKLCQAYREQYGFNAIALMPSNLYGPGDSFHPQYSHAMPALIRKLHEAQLENRPRIALWGTGSPLREFLHVDDMADACVFLMRNYDSGEIINVGVGADISILDLARMIANVVGYQGKIEFDASKPDGTPRKLMDVRRLHSLGWHHRIHLEEGIRSTYRWYLENVEQPQLISDTNLA